MCERFLLPLQARTRTNNVAACGTPSFSASTDKGAFHPFHSAVSLLLTRWLILCFNHSQEHMTPSLSPPTQCRQRTSPQQHSTRSALPAWSRQAASSLSPVSFLGFHLSENTLIILEPACNFTEEEVKTRFSDPKLGQSPFLVPLSSRNLTASPDGRFLNRLRIPVSRLPLPSPDERECVGPLTRRALTNVPAQGSSTRRSRSEVPRGRRSAQLRSGRSRHDKNRMYERGKGRSCGIEREIASHGRCCWKTDLRAGSREE